MKSLFILAFLVALGSPALAAVSEVWVDAIFGDDILGDGTEALPFRTITRGVQALGSSPGTTTVHVAPGMYGPTLGESFPIQLKTSMNILGSGITRTYISGDGDYTLLRLAPKAMISDMTLMRADTAVESTGWGVNIRYIRRCVIQNSELGLYCEDSMHSDIGTIVINSAIINNGVGVTVHSPDMDWQSSTVLLYGCTVIGNTTAMQAYGWGETFLGLFDSIVRGNGDDMLTGWSALLPGPTGNVLGDPNYVGSGGNIDVDPELIPLGAGNFHLTTTSPVIDNPAPPVDWPPAPFYIGPSHWIWEATFEEIEELDGDARKIGAAIDPGADELVLPTLYLYGRTQLGSPFLLGNQAEPFDSMPLYFSFSLYPSPWMGFLWLEWPMFPLANMVMDDQGVAGLQLLLPDDPILVGLDIYFQSFRKKTGPWEGTAPLWVRVMP